VAVAEGKDERPIGPLLALQAPQRLTRHYSRWPELVPVKILSNDQAATVT
jgi:hypothetical protein